MDQNPKQAIVEKVKSASSVLVTVSTNPTVDQLSAAIGLTLMLGALDVKSAAVFSGDVPDVLQFLEPNKSISKDVNALRDFIISIDKDKADKLRYKVEDNVVKIYITPYKTTLSQDDLEFSQGDINVDLVIALGVHSKNDLDQAIVSHGRILHDATIASITAGADAAPELGSINWHDETASSLSEMLVSISEALRSGMLDKSMSTAFLTGIVAATERFSNEKTSPKVMTMSAQLMAAGADQQLIARNLRMDRGRTTPRPEQPQQSVQTADATVVDLHADEKVPPKPETLEQLEQEFDEPGTDKTVPELHVEEKESDEVPVPDNRKIIKGVKPIMANSPDEEPSIGGTFNATSAKAHEEAVADLVSPVNKAILSHEQKQPLESAQEPAVEIAAEPAVPPPAPEPLPPPPPVIHPDDPAPQPAAPAPMPQPVQESVVDPIAEARKAVDQAVNTADFDPAHHPTAGVGAQPLENATTDVNISGEINIDPSGKLNPIGDQPMQPTENPVQPRMEQHQADAFSLPKPHVVQPLPPQPEPEPTLPPQQPTPHIRHNRRRMAEEPQNPDESNPGMMGVTDDDEEQPVDNTFLVSKPSPENAVPNAPPPLPPKPASPGQQPPANPQNPLFNQQ